MKYGIKITTTTWGTLNGGSDVADRVTGTKKEMDKLVEKWKLRRHPEPEEFSDVPEITYKVVPNK